MLILFGIWTPTNHFQCRMGSVQGKHSLNVYEECLTQTTGTMIEIMMLLTIVCICADLDVLGSYPGFDVCGCP